VTDEFPGSFTVRLVVKHPKISLDAIREALSLEPTHGHTVGAPRKTPIGRPLEGVWSETFFGHSKEFDCRRDFFAAALEFARSLSERSGFIRRIRADGGLVAIYVDLKGCENFGDVMAPELLSLLSSLDIDFGIEIFPRSEKRSRGRSSRPSLR
jgi:hypothetical protein